MHSATKTKLSKDTLDTLQELIRANIDSRDSLREAARHIEDLEITAVFREVELQRNDQVSELRSLVAANAEEPEESGTTMAAIYRAWTGLQQAIGSGVASLIQEAQRGEEYMLDQYERARRDLLDTQLMDVLDRHSAAIRAAQIRLSELQA